MKIPGIYMIQNNLDGKVYIGQSVDILHRIKYYKWESESGYSEDNAKYYRPIILAIKDQGIDNFTFTILESGIQFEDERYRAFKEKEYIRRYNSTNPEYGYNTTAGGETGPINPRMQSEYERIKRCVPIYAYDTLSDTVIILPGGAQQFAKRHGYERTIITRNIKRASLVENRYYLFYKDPDKRQEVVDRISKIKDAEIDPNITDKRFASAQRTRRSALSKYLEALKRVNEVDADGDDWYPQLKS